MVVENLLKEKIGEYLLKKYSIPNSPVEIIKTRKEFKGDYTIVLFPILSLTKLKPNQIEMYTRLVLENILWHG